MSDEELQHNIEKGYTGNEPDDRAYELVFRALKREPKYSISADFANRVINRLPRTQSSRDTVWLYVGVGSFVIAMIIAIGMTGFRANWGVFKFISNYQGLIVFAVLFIIGLQWFERRLLKRTT